MRYVVPVLLAVCVLVLTCCLLVPVVDRGMSWQEALLGIIPSAVLGLVVALLFLFRVGTPAAPRPGNRALFFWIAALAWALLVGGVVSLATSKSHRENLQLAREESRRTVKGGFNLYEAYARYDEIGMACGWGVLGFAGVSAVGLVLQAIRTASAQRENGTGQRDAAGKWSQGA
jgi:hypothetical protein